MLEQRVQVTKERTTDQRAVPNRGTDPCVCRSS